MWELFLLLLFNVINSNAAAVENTTTNSSTTPVWTECHLSPSGPVQVQLCSGCSGITRSCNVVSPCVYIYDGFTVASDNGVSYLTSFPIGKRYSFYSSMSMPFSSASAFCQLVGGTLPFARSVQEFDMMTNFAQNTDLNWIGLTIKSSTSDCSYPPQSYIPECQTSSAYWMDENNTSIDFSIGNTTFNILQRGTCFILYYYKNYCNINNLYDCNKWSISFFCQKQCRKQVPSQNTTIVCDNHSDTIKCSNPDEVLIILSGLYAQTDGIICSFFNGYDSIKNSGCNTSISGQLKNLCQGMSSCLISADSFSSYCSQSNNYVEVNYTCTKPPYWSSWSSWSNCIEVYGQPLGYQNRNRNCTFPPETSKSLNCIGNSSIITSCYIESIWDYGEWSSCSSTCGFSYKFRINNCLKGCLKYGNKTTEKEWTQCNVDDCGDYYLSKQPECSTYNSNCLAEPEKILNASLATIYYAEVGGKLELALDEISSIDGKQTVCFNSIAKLNGSGPLIEPSLIVEKINFFGSDIVVFGTNFNSTFAQVYNLSTGDWMKINYFGTKYTRSSVTMVPGNNNLMVFSGDINLTTETFLIQPETISSRYTLNKMGSCMIAYDQSSILFINGYYPATNLTDILKLTAKNSALYFTSSIIGRLYPICTLLDNQSFFIAGGYSISASSASTPTINGPIASVEICSPSCQVISYNDIPLNLLDPFSTYQQGNVFVTGGTIYETKQTNVDILVFSLPTSMWRTITMSSPNYPKVIGQTLSAYSFEKNRCSPFYCPGKTYQLPMKTNLFLIPLYKTFNIMLLDVETVDSVNVYVTMGSSTSLKCTFTFFISYTPSTQRFICNFNGDGIRFYYKSNFDINEIHMTTTSTYNGTMSVNSSGSISSYYSATNVIKNQMFLPLGIQTDKNKLFLSDGSIFPWIQVDFGWSRFLNKVNVTLTDNGFQQLDNASLEIRFGYEKLWSDLKPIQVNDFCAELNHDSIPDFTDGKNISVFGADCNRTINGRYLTIQLKNCGHLEISEVTIIPAPIHGFWTEWSSWTNCTLTLSPNWYQTRKRTCNPPFNGGMACQGSDNASLLCVPVRGGWTNWTLTKDCNNQTSNGAWTKTYQRKCTNPVPLYGGLTCEQWSKEPAINITQCPTPIDGKWSNWGEFSNCSMDAKSSEWTKTRNRSCTNPPPQFLGQNCSSTNFAVETVICPPIDGNWSMFTNWTDCSSSCGLSVMTRERTCDNPAPIYKGKYCIGDATESQTCDVPKCPVNGNWSNWSNWSECSQLCGTGFMTRERNCSNPSAAYGGQFCVGLSYDQEDCNTESCQKFFTAGDSSTVQLPVDPPNLATVQFAATTIYYWPEFNLNATYKTTYKVVSGPFQFGNALQLNKSKSECFADERFIHANDQCFRNLANCPDGLSLSLFYQVSDPTDSGTPGVKEFILSTGGEIGTPGVGIFFNGVDLGVTLCAENLTWSLLIAGQRPGDANWYNIAIRWKMPNYKNASDFATQKMNNVRTKDMGGLEVFVNMMSIGYVLLPDEVGCAVTNPTNTCPANSTYGQALDPPEVLLGCHKTQALKSKRYFASGIYDEVAFWPRRLNDTELPYFLGGYKSSLENVALNVLLQILQNVNMSNSGQANTAISVVNTLVQGADVPQFPTGNVYDTTTQQPSTTITVGSNLNTSPTSATSTVATTTTTAAPVDKASTVKQLIQVMFALTNSYSIPQSVSTSLFEILFNVALPVGEIMSLKGKYEDGWNALISDPSKVGAPKNRKALQDYLVTLLKNRAPNYQGTTSYDGTRVTSNFGVQLKKMTAQEFGNLAPAGADGYFTFPNWEDPRWNSFLQSSGEGLLPIDSVQVPTNIFTGSCKTQNVNFMGSIFDTFPDPGRKNPVNIPANHILLDSRVITVNITADPVSGIPGSCFPDDKLLLSYPLTISMGMTSQYKMSQTSSRKLKFHDENPNNTVVVRYCVIWNDDLFGVGGWDPTGIKSIYSDNTVTNCFSNKLGTYAVIAQLEDVHYVPNDDVWLIVIKIIGYILSFILLTIFIVAVYGSAYLWEMFHIIGMNLAAAIFLADVFMCLSELDVIRSDRHSCASIGILIDFFYTASSIMLMMESHAVFRATTTGIIGGKTKGYLFIGWGIPFIAVGLNIYLQLVDMGDDPRCMVGWSSLVKWFFFVPVLCAASFSLLSMMVVMCNLQAPALRKKSLYEDHSSLAKGHFILVFLYSLCWALAPEAYINFPGLELPNFYPAFQVLNSFMGAFVFFCIGVGSKKFRKVAAERFSKKAK